MSSVVNILRSIRIRWALLLLLALVSGWLCGCGTTDPDNLSARPWNTPKSWEGGLPSNITEGR